MADVAQHEGEELGQWVERVRRERREEVAQERARADQEVLETETARASTIIEGIVPTIKRALEKEGDTGNVERIVIAMPGFVKLEDFDPRATRFKKIEDVYWKG